MVDKPARDRVASLIEAYLDDRLTAFEFDDSLQALETKDETVNTIVRTCWMFYDDCVDHTVVLDKAGWDLMQRLLLILRSDGELLISPAAREWGWDNLLAAACCALLALSCILTGWGMHLLLISIPLGFVSMSISNVRSKREQDVNRDLTIEPFASVAELMRVRRQLPTFRKRRYRGGLRERRIRSRAEEVILWVQAGALWLVFSRWCFFFRRCLPPDPGPQSGARMPVPVLWFCSAQ